MHSLGSAFPDTVIVTVRVTDELGTVLNVSCALGAAASLNTPLSVTEKSASKSRRSTADELMSVMSCTPRGVPNEQFVMSFEIVRAVPPESSTATAMPRPDSLAIGVPLYPCSCAHTQKPSVRCTLAARCRFHLPVERI